MAVAGMAIGKNGDGSKGNSKETDNGHRGWQWQQQRAMGDGLGDRDDGGSNGRSNGRSNGDGNGCSGERTEYEN